MLKVERAIAFTLPDGSYIKVETTGTGREGVEAGPDDWSALDVTLVRKDESESLLCSVEYDDPKGLRTLVYNDDSEKPIFTHVNGYDGEIPYDEEETESDNCQTGTYDCETCCLNGRCIRQEGDDEA